MTEGGTELVRLPALGGVPLPVPGTAGATVPDVGPDGRIATVLHPDAASAAASIVVLDPLSGVATPVPAAASAAESPTASLHPVWSCEGGTLFFAQATIAADSPQYPRRTHAFSVDLTTGELINLTQTPYVNEDTAIVLVQDGSRPDPNPPAGPGSAVPVADTTAPAVALAAPAAATAPVAVLGGLLVPAWSATDPTVAGAQRSELASYDARYRAQSARNAFGSYTYPAAWQGTTQGGATLALKPGYQYCVSARARDYAGRTSAWSPERFRGGDGHPGTADQVPESGDRGRRGDDPLKPD